MRTLKKTLCLVLCLVMMVGLCAVGASAKEFTDADQIQYKEAVDVLTGIGVINGMGDGTFAPKGTLTRAQAAKIITYLLGYQDIKGTASFDDVKGAEWDWAAGSIALCASEGIVAGVGDNKFDPNGKLTGSAWGKMLLCALGYNAEFEGLIGVDWEIGVAKLLKNINLTSGITGLDLTKEINRETACQMAFTALGKDTFIYRPGVSVTGSGIEVSTAGTYSAPQPTLGQRSFGIAQTVDAAGYDIPDFDIAIVVDTPATVAGQKFSTVNGTFAGLGAGARISTELDADMVGHAVKIYYNTTANPTTLVYTAYAVEDVTGTVTIKSTATAAQVKAAFAAVGVDTTVGYLGGDNIIANGVVAGATQPINWGVTTGAIAKGTWLINTAASPATIIGKDAGISYSIDQVAAINTAAGKESITLAGAGLKQNNATTDVVNAYDGIAVGDVVLVYATGTMFELVKPEIETGIVKATNGAAFTITTTDGKVYGYNGYDANTSTLVDVYGAITIGEEYKFYLDKDGGVAAVVGIAGAEDLVYVVATYTKNTASNYGAGTAQYFIQGINGKGEEVNYQVYHEDHDGNPGTPDEYVLTTGSATAIAPDTIYTVTTAYDAAQFANMATLTALNGATKHQAQTTSTANALTKALVKTYNGDYLSDNVQFITFAGQKDFLKIKVVEGKQTVPVTAPTPTTYTVYSTKLATATNWDVKYVFVKGGVTDATQQIAFAAETRASSSAVAYTKADGTTGTAYNHTVYVDGAKQTIQTEAAAALAGYFTLTTDSKTGITTATAYTNTNVAKTSYAADKLMNVKDSYVTINGGIVDDYDISAAKIVDLTGNGIETGAQLAAIFAATNPLANSWVKISVVYNAASAAAAKPISELYITEASFTAPVIADASPVTTATTPAAIAAYFNGVDVVADPDAVLYAWTKKVGTTTTVIDGNDEAPAGADAAVAAGAKINLTVTVTTPTGYTFTAKALEVTKT